MSELTAEDLRNMDPVALLKLVSDTTACHTVGELVKLCDTLTAAGPGVPLDDNASVENTSPVAVPLGALKARPDLGVLGVRVKVIMTLERVGNIVEKEVG